MRSYGPQVDIKLRIFGGFVFKKRGGVEYQVYEAGFTYWKLNVYMSYIKLGYLRYLCGEGIKIMGWEITQDYVLWFKEKGKSWMTGKRRMDNDDDVKAFIEEARHKDGYYELFCTVFTDPSEMESEQPISNNPPLDSPKEQTHKGPNTSSEPTTQLPPQKSQKSSASTSRKSSNPENNLSKSVSTQNDVGQSQTTPKKSLVAAIPVRRSPRLTKVGSGSDLGDSVGDKGKGKVLRLEKGKEKVVELGKDVKSGSDSQSNSGTDSDSDVDWEAEEEEGYDNEEQEWFLGSRNQILGEVDASLQFLRQIGESSGAIVRQTEKVLSQLSKDIDDDGKDINVQDEPSDSDELISLHGSDEELDDSPWFREETDFKKPIVLQNNQKFSSASVLRKALRTHAIENRYEFYYLHNGGNRITTFCKRRCGCEWNRKRSSLPECQCSDEVKKCDFKVSARRQHKSSVFQIKDLRIKHRCMRSIMNSKVTAEFLAEKYLEEWRSNPLWEIRSFQDRILNDLGIKVRYSKAYLARTRVKFMIYGSCAEQYAMVWTYGKALIKYMPTTGVVIVVDSIDKPEPPLFMRMYVCLAPLRSGFIKGCRPLIGVDGCHLKGAYPGQILVAVGKDGNNNIFPIAWATVEVENKDTWAWFLQCLKKDLHDYADGGGFTYMSDRQKGLLEAFEMEVPFAEKRYCVRHIWANFKLQFSGPTFKELFWNAARATTVFDFEVAMESIKFLSEEAFEYLEQIPAKHWSRHAFDSDCKSNLIRNNVCETFNSVIRDARDKPILSQMEWIRRYMMRRNNEKWEAAQIMGGRFTPYVHKVFERMERVARHYIVQQSRGDSYEVQLNGDQVLVDLGARNCTCYHWQLTGIPCVHGFACILDKRVDPEAYVDKFYSMEKYLQAYEDAIQPMPGPKYWEKVDLRKPLPPPVRVMPGRPKSKKRKRERGESSGREPKSRKSESRCKSCGELGHYAKTCKNSSVPTTTASEPKKPAGKPILHTPWNEEQRRKREARAAWKTAEGAGPWSIANKSRPSQASASNQLIQASQASTSTTTTRSMAKTKLLQGSQKSQKKK